MVSKILRADGTTELASIQSVTYHESVNADTDLRPGCVASSYIEVTCFGAQSDAPAVGEALTYYQVVGSTETLIGIFYAEPSIPTKNSYKFIAYDAVHKLDADFSAWLSANQDNFPYTVYQLVSQACTIAGVTLGSSSWLNSSMSVNAFYTDGLTCRNILQYAAEVGCKFVRCNTSGEVIFDWYAKYSNRRIYPSSGTSGSETRYAYKQDGLTYDNYATSAVARVAVHPVGEDDVAYYYPTNVQSGNTLSITNNLMLYGKTSAAMTSIASNIYSRMVDLGTYRPMTAEMFPNECPIRAGDVVQVTDVQGVSFTTIVMEKTVTDSAVTLTSTGREVYGDYALDTAKQLVQLAADIVRINKLKVDWAEIGTAIIDTLEANGINADWINAGALTILDANNQVIFKADRTSKTVQMGSWYADKYYIYSSNNDPDITDLYLGLGRIIFKGQNGNAKRDVVIDATDLTFPGSSPETRVVARLFNVKEGDSPISGSFAIGNVIESMENYALFISSYFDGTNITNDIQFYENSVSVKTPSAWRKAIGLGDASGNLPITVAQGGSGQTDVISKTAVSDVIASTATGYTVTGVSLKIWGKFAQIGINIKASSTGTVSDLHVCALKPIAVPSGTTSLICGGNFSVATISTSGELIISGNFASTSTTYSFRGTYILP